MHTATRSWFLAMRHSNALAVVAALMGLGLLLAFQQTVSGGVERGDQRRKDARSQVDGAWRCTLLADRQQRTRCEVQLAGAPSSPLADARSH
jgi:hypothetical protein